MAQKLTLEAADADFERVLAAAEKAVRRVEPGCMLIK